MSRKSRRGRPARQYRIRVRTERRDPIDYAALAQAALEQAAMNQPRGDTTNRSPSRGQQTHQGPDGQEQTASVEGVTS